MEALPVALLSVLLISLVSGMPPLVKAETNPPKAPLALLLLYSPQNKTYSTNSIVLNVSVEVLELGQSSGETGEAFYSLDGEKNVSIPLAYAGVFYDSPESMLLSHYSGTANLTSLSDGSHQITAYGLLKIGEITENCYSPQTVYFTVDEAPQIVFLIAQNRTYETTDLALGFTVNKPTSKITYSLDGRENVTIAGNITLTGLSSGYHNLKVYATDEIGTTGASETLFFEVVVPFPIVPIASSVAIIVIAMAVLLVYWKKRKRQTQ